jgi:hypothetical protein
LFCLSRQFFPCYSYETSNGIKVEESGYVKPAIDVRRGPAEGTTDENTGDSQVIQGSYSYVAPDGSPISLTYDHTPNIHWLIRIRKIRKKIQYSKTNKMYFLYSGYYKFYVMSTTCSSSGGASRTTIGILRVCYVCWLLPGLKWNLVAANRHNTHAI